MPYKIDTVKDDAGRWRWMLDGGKVSSSESFDSEADAVKAAEEWIEMYEATVAPPVEEVVEGEVEVEKVEVEKVEEVVEGEVPVEEMAEEEVPRVDRRRGRRP